MDHLLKFLFKNFRIKLTANNQKISTNIHTSLTFYIQRNQRGVPDNRNELRDILSQIINRKSMDPSGIEPESHPCKGYILPLNDEPVN